MGRRERLERIARKTRGLADTFELEDGSTHTARPGDRLEALLASIAGEGHELHEPLSKLSPEADEDAKEFRELLEALGAYDGAHEEEPQQH
jgi:hypothetical protein